MRILGLDYGDKTVGVSVSDPFGWSAQGVEIIRRNSPEEYKQSLGRIEELIKEYSIEKIVLGFPKNMDGSEGARCEKTLAYKEKIEKRFPKTEVILWDERLSTVAADRYMMSADLGHDKRKSVIDKMAAVFILQGYLDYMRNQNDRNDENEEEIIVLENDDGTDEEYAVCCQKEKNGTVYIFAVNEQNKSEYIIMKEVLDEDGDICYETLEDDEELNNAKMLFKDSIDKL